MKAEWILFALLLAVPAFGQGRADLREGPLKVGDLAPDFTLKTLDGKSTIKLSALRGKQPVVLVFGSYT